MHQPLHIHALFQQLQARYPTSGLLTDLVQIQEGQYIVKAMVQVGSTAIATSLAAAPTLEQAEDQARSRVLALLGIGISSHGAGSPPLPSVEPLPPPSNGFAPLPPPTWLESDGAVADLPPLAIAPEPPALPTYTPLPEPIALSAEPVVASTDHPFPEPSIADFAPPLMTEEIPIAPVADKAGSDRPAPKSKKSPRAEAAMEALRQAEAIAETIVPQSAPPPDQPLPEPDDLSFLIAQTDVEMDRIGWTKQQGRDYLKETYNKSTRQRLDADELMDFLNYLRALPSLHGL